MVSDKSAEYPIACLKDKYVLENIHLGCYLATRIMKLCLTFCGQVVRRDQMLGKGVTLVKVKGP